MPLVGSPQAAATQKDSFDFHWLRSRQFLFGLTSLYGLASVLSFIAWMRDRKQRLLFWMAAYTFMPVLEVLLNGIRSPVSTIWLTWIIQTAIGIREICQWFLRKSDLLQLDEYPKLVRLARIGATVGCWSDFWTC